VARFEPVNREGLSPEHKTLYDAALAGRPKLVGPFSVLMHNPALAGPINKVVDAIRRDGKLDKRLYELVVLITARHAGAAYAWAVHDPLGRKAGLSGEVVEAIQAKKKPNFAKADEKAIYEAVTELLNTNRIGDAAYQELIKQFGLPTTIEIVTCAGLYCMIGGVINAFEVPTANGEKPF
jgi:4-carboxymuconolactone decarboxylase